MYCSTNLTTLFVAIEVEKFCFFCVLFSILQRVEILATSSCLEDKECQIPLHDKGGSVASAGAAVLKSLSRLVASFPSLPPSSYPLILFS